MQASSLMILFLYYSTISGDHSSREFTMRTIEVDFDVFKALTMRRPSEIVSENDVLRELLGLPTQRQSTGLAAEPAGRATGAGARQR